MSRLVEGSHQRISGAGSIAVITAFVASHVIMAAGCAVPNSANREAESSRTTISVLGIFDDYNEILRGTGIADKELHVQFYEFRGLVSGIRCVGHGRMTHMPSDSVFPDHCKGMKGISNVTCTDGRIVETEYHTDDSCLGGFGVGNDQFGNTLSFVYGLPDDEAETAVRAEMKRASKRQPLETYRPGEVRARHGYSSGTAFAIGTGGAGSAAGYFVTSHHVVADAEKIWLMDHEGNDHPLTYIRGDAKNDLALLRAESFSPPLLPVRPASRIRKGDEVLALGYPLLQMQGQEQKATFGHINALSGAGGDERFLQIDTPIQPGNSGGPLLDSRGNAIGVITATLDQVATFRAAGVVPQNVNYALKAELVLDLIEGSTEISTLTPVVTTDAPITVVVDRTEASVYIVVAR